MAFGVIAYIAYYFYINRDDFNIVFDIDPGVIICIVLLHLVYFVIHAFRFKIVIEKCSGASISYWHWFRVTMVGGFLNKIVPQSGNVYRGLQLKKIYNVSYTQFATGFLFFIWTDTFINISIASILIIALGFQMTIIGLSAGGLLPSLALFLLLAPILFNVIIKKRWILSKYFTQFYGKISELIKTTNIIIKDYKFNIKFILLGMLVFIPMCTRIYITFILLDIHLSLSILILFYTLIKISQLVNITPGNLGIQELALGYIAEQGGVGMDAGIVAAVILRMLAYIVQMSCGVVFGGIGILFRKESVPSPDIS